MEKIKKALEKARNEREKGGGVTRSSHMERDGSLESTSIEYTKTRSVHGSVEQMRENRLVNLMDRGVYSESLKILGTQVLQRMEENNWNSLAVSSPRSSAGATTVAINLGMSIAKEVGYTVLVVDANLREPMLHEYFGIQPKVGLTDYLTAGAPLEDLLIHPEGVDDFVILPSGSASSTSAELLGSPKMRTLVQEMTARYPNRIVIFDTPSVLDSSDLLNFSPSVDSVLMVIEDDETKESDLLTAVNMITSTSIIGTVVNKSAYA